MNRTDNRLARSLGQTPTTERRRPQLDGLRAVAVSMVVAEHAGFPFSLSNEPIPLFGASQSGVRLFFVLSGFLITGILLRARGSARIWQTFYVRRALRIFPLAYVAIFIAWRLGLEFTPVWYVAQAANIRAALIGGWEQGLGHFWSLAVEEQFYLIWPALILLIPDRHLAKSIAGLILAAGVLRGLVVADGHGVAAYVLTPTRLDSLAAGGLCALALHRDRTAARWTIRWASVVAAVTFAVGLLLPRAGRATMHEWALIGVSAAIVVAAAQDAPAGRALAWRPLVYLGTISYGIYVWHPLVPFVVMYLQYHLNLTPTFPTAGVGKLIMMGIGAIAAAAASWHFFERPLNRLKRFFPYP